jgi:hypothetical protein
MHRSLTLLTYSAAACFFVAGCSSQQEAANALPSGKSQQLQTKVAGVAELPKQERDVFVFRAKYYQGKGPCIKIGDSLAMPAIDAFEIVEVLQGDLIAKNVDVRAMTQGGPSYPKKLAEGKTYTLRLRPSEKTKQQMQENRKEGFTFLWVDGDELEEHMAGR